MKNKNVRGILALVLVTALSFGVIIGSKTLAISMGTEQNTGTAAADAKVLKELDVAGAEGIEKAVKTETGYMVTVRTKGYGGDIVMNVAFDEEAKNVTGAEVVEHSETEGLGALIAETDFLSQFEGVAAPVFLPGMSLEAAPAQESKAEANPAADTTALALNDGTYTVNTTEADQSGFTEEMTMVVEGGKITSVVWDCVDADGNRKSVLSENGQYVMTENGPTWKEQAESLAAALVEHQSLNVFTMDAQGKTDAVSGVSISIGGFVAMAEECLAQAAGEAAEETESETEVVKTEAAETAAPQNGTQVDAVSGATISSTAAVTGINKAYEFLQAAK